METCLSKSATIIGYCVLTALLSSHFSLQGIACFGPCARAARIESSKAYSKRFMQRHHLPTAAFEVFTDFEQARQYIESVGYRVVVKVNFKCFEFFALLRVVLARDR